MPRRVLELFCGIGGLAVALPEGVEVAAALDVSELALAAYRANFTHRAHACAIEALRDDDPRLAEADLWWLSPPCQPYTRRGLGRDLDDPRSAGLARVVRLLERRGPAALALENVPEFAGSAGHGLLRAALARGGYAVAERLLCPTALGVPNRRRRFYLVAGREGLAGWAANGAAAAPAPLRPLASYLDADPHPELAVDPALLRRYAHAADVADARDPAAVAATFTSAYGRSPVRAGSYLRQDGVVRHFHPREVLRLLGFPAEHRFPEGMPLAAQWRLAGNSLSVPAVREVLSALLPA